MRNPDLIREVRGVMTRFEPLTEEIVSTHAADGLTYSELTEVLRSYGLDIRKVVHDPSRQILSTYYADYHRGLYCLILLQREYLHGAGLAEFRALARKGEISSALAEQDWSTYYLKDVPLAMQIYDFQRRYRDIPQEQVFTVWYEIYRRIDYANGMWLPEVLEYVLHSAPPTQLPPADEDGLITIYRGMGELSMPPEQAVSWSSHPGNALWFAIRSGRGTHIAVARVKPEQIVAYFPTYYAENEVLVLPGTISEYRYENMIPASPSVVPQMLALTLPDYQHYGRLARSLGYQRERLFQVHGLLHVLRVLLLSLLYIYTSGDALTEDDHKILVYFSLFHDLGRTDDSQDDEHGSKSVELIREKRIRIHDIRLSSSDQRIADLIITHHCHDDDIGVAAIMAEQGLPNRDRERAVHLYHICKDMDGLDRVRFNGLDYRMLRTEYAREMPLIAGCLLEEELIEVLDMELPE